MLIKTAFIRGEIKMATLWNSISDILYQYIAENSGKKIIISPGESILLILEALFKQADSPGEIIEKISKLYFEGVKTAEQKQFILDLTIFFQNKGFIVSTSPEVINKDPTRRYFESHLAYNLIVDFSKNTIPLSMLEKLRHSLEHRLFSIPTIAKNSNLKTKIKKMLSGMCKEDIETMLSDKEKGVLAKSLELDKYQLEYAELIYKLRTATFFKANIDPQQPKHNTAYEESKKTTEANFILHCKKLAEIACCTVLATHVTQYDTSLPVDVYTDGIFTMGMDGRGRLLKNNHAQVKTGAKGLMRSIDPLPYDDVVNQHSLSSENIIQVSQFQRSADQATFMIESQWSQHLFSRLTQPYSNGISSTTLAQIRNLIMEKRLGKNHFNKCFLEYITLFAGLMVYNSGGHSFFEIFEVLKLNQFRELLQSEKKMYDALDKEELMTYCLYTSRRQAFDSALTETLKYMRQLLNKKYMHAELKSEFRSIFTQSEPTILSPVLTSSLKKTIDVPEQCMGAEGAGKNYTIHDAVILLDSKEFSKWLQTYNGKIDRVNNTNWTALMVAAQAGKVDYIKSLIGVKANLNYRIKSGELSIGALEVAVKAGRYEAAKLLICAGINSIDTSGGTDSSLKKKCPAFYLACRQTNPNIPLLFLNQNKLLTYSNIREALLTALRVENEYVLVAMISSIPLPLRVKVFEKGYTFKLAQEAVSLGSTKLVSIIFKQLVTPGEAIDFNLLLNISIRKHYVDVAHQLLKLSIEYNSPINFYHTLLLAFEEKNYNLILLFVLYGADLRDIPLNLLKELELFLNEKKYDLEFLKNESPQFLVQTVEEVQGHLNNKIANFYHRILELLIKVINFFLPEHKKMITRETKVKTLVTLSALFSEMPQVEKNSPSLESGEPPILEPAI